LSLSALADLLGERKSDTPITDKKVAHRAAPDPSKRASNSNDGLLTAAQVFNALSEIRPANAVLVEESPSNHADLNACWPITEPASYFTAASGGLGFGLPASAGIALGERETGRNRPVIAIMGDGSFQYSVQSLWTAAQQHLPIAVIVLRNREYAILKSLAAFEGIPNLPGLDLPGLDIVSIAKGFGCDAALLDDLNSIKTATAKAWTKSKPTVLEIPISSQVPPLC
jgi:benzoylformate decarboxylase